MTPEGGREASAEGGPARAPLPPLLRWAGSKRQIAQALERYWTPESRRYIEPFAGSACLFFRLRPPASVLNDLNSELITFYCIVADMPEQTFRELQELGGANATTYARVRGLDPSSLPCARRAARFIYLNRFGFNGLYRTNGRGEYNVPYGGDRTGSVPSKDRLLEYGQALGESELLSHDFADVCELASAGDFVYLDPPYAVQAEWRRGLYYTEDAFAIDDVARLAEALKGIDSRGATFLLSYSDSDEGRQLAAAWSSTAIEVRRTIAGSAFKRVRQRELLISNLRRLPDDDVRQ